MFSANRIYTVFFLCSRKFKITNHGPQAVSLKEPETPISLLKQVCEDLETVGPRVFPGSLSFSGISCFLIVRGNLVEISFVIKRPWSLYPFFPFTFSPTLHSPAPLATISLVSVSTSLLLVFLFVFLYWIPHIGEIIRYLSFSAWLISLNITPSRSIYVVKNGKISFLSWWSLHKLYKRWVTIVCKCISSVMHTPETHILHVNYILIF